MGRIIEYIKTTLSKCKVKLKDKNFREELLVILVFACAGEVIIYIAILWVNLLFEIPSSIRFPNIVEVVYLIIAGPVAIASAFTGHVLFSRHKLNKKFGQNLEQLSIVNEVLSREDTQPDKYLPYKMVVSKIFLGDNLSAKVTALSGGGSGLSVNTGKFASILQLFLYNLERNYTKSVHIYSTCTLTPVRFMQDDLQTYRKKWEEFGAKFVLKPVCPIFVRLILPDISPGIVDNNRKNEYKKWEVLLQNETTSSQVIVNSFIDWNKKNCFKLFKLTKPYPQNYYGVEFNPSPVNDFLIIAESSNNKPKGHVIIGGSQDHSKQDNNHWNIKYEKEAARLEHYCDYFNFLELNSKKINALSDLVASDE